MQKEVQENKVQETLYKLEQIFQLCNVTEKEKDLINYYFEKVIVYEFRHKCGFIWNLFQKDFIIRDLSIDNRLIEKEFSVSKIQYEKSKKALINILYKPSISEDNRAKIMRTIGELCFYQVASQTGYFWDILVLNYIAVLHK